MGTGEGVKAARTGERCGGEGVYTRGSCAGTGSGAGRAPGDGCGMGSGSGKDVASGEAKVSVVGGGVGGPEEAEETEEAGRGYDRLQRDMDAMQTS